jgi:CRISPR-associated protein Cmr4
MITTDTQSAHAQSLYTLQRLLFMTLDPVHIGTGGYRLGRVDMTIAREPGTNLPKIPGTSLAGAARSYAAMSYGRPEAAGKHGKFKGDKNTCPIIYTFGTATDASSAEGGSTRAGTVSIADARILFFPVNSMAGPVWVSTVDIVREAWGENSVTLPQNVEPTDDVIVTNMNRDENLNLGWLLFKCTKGLTINPPTSLLSHLEWKGISDRIVLVTPKLFSQIVNSNLEVRTSVSIDPKTGAADSDSGALFTYEAIPRTTWLWSDVVEDDYGKNRPYRGSPGTSSEIEASMSTAIPIGIESNNDNYPFPVNKQYDSKNNAENAGADLPNEDIWKQPLHVVSTGMRLIEYLGIGGMGTRGFGRMRLVDEWVVKEV